MKFILLLITLTFSLCLADTGVFDDKNTQFVIAQNYETGKNVKKDLKKAAEFYKKSAGHGYAKAQYKLAMAHYQGKGVSKDYTIAAKWLKKAAIQDNAQAQLQLGIFHYHGYGVLKSYKEAVYWIKKSNNNGNLEAKDAWKKFELWKYE